MKRNCIAFKKTIIALNLLAVFSSANAVINENPVVGKKYDDYLIYDNDGSQTVSMQGSELGKVHEYYFNKGALLDGTKGSLQSVLLVHNWADNPSTNPETLNTKTVINVGQGENLTLKNYTGYGAITVEEGATLEINKGNIVLETGMSSSSDMSSNDSEVSGFNLQDGGKFIVKAESFLMGNLREDKNNTGGMNIYGNFDSTVDIKLSKTFDLHDVAFGIAAQGFSDKNASVSVNAENGININASYEGKNILKGVLGSGIYLLAYGKNEDNGELSHTKLDLTSSKGDISVYGNRVGIYAYGNVNSTITSTQGKVCITADKDNAIYLGGLGEDSDYITTSNELNITAGKSIEVISKQKTGINVYGEDVGNGIKAILTAGDDITISGQKYGISAYNGAIETKSGGRTAIVGNKYGMTLTNADVDINTNTLWIDSVEDSYSLCVYDGSDVTANVNTSTIIDDQVYVSAGKFTLTSSEAIFNDQIRALSGGVIDITALNSFTASVSDNPENTIIKASDKSKITGVLGKSLVKGNIYSLQESSVDLKFSKQSEYTGATGILSKDQADGTLKLDLSEKSVWKITDDSSMSKLVLNDSTLDFSSYQNDKANNHQYRTLTTNTLEGGKGILKMQIDLAQENVDNKLLDQLIVKEAATGTHQLALALTGEIIPENKQNSVNWLISQGEGSNLTITNANGTDTFSGRGMVSVWSLGFVASGEEEKLNTDSGRAEIANQTTGTNKGDWYLVKHDVNVPDPNPELPPEVQDNIDVANSASIAMAYDADMDTLRTRIGEIRYGAQDGLWAKAFSKQNRLGGAGLPGLKQEIYGLNLGLDHLVAADEESAWLLGGAFRYSDADQKGLGVGYTTGKLQEYSGKLYATWMHDKGSYADFVLQAGRYEQELDGFDNTGMDKAKADYGTWGFGASVEVGHMFSFGDNVDDRQWFNHWFVEPQLQLSYFLAKGADYTTSTGLKINQGDADYLTGRAGVVLGKKFNYDLDKRYFQIAMIGGVKHEFIGGDQSIRYTGTEGDSIKVNARDIDGSRFYYGVNADWQLSRDWRLYAQFEREKGNDFSEDYDVSVGFKYAF